MPQDFSFPICPSCGRVTGKVIPVCPTCAEAGKHLAQPERFKVAEVVGVADVSRLVKERDEAIEGMTYAYEQFRQVLPTYDAALQEVLESGNQSALSATLIAIEMLVRERDEARAEADRMKAAINEGALDRLASRDMAELRRERDEARAEAEHLRALVAVALSEL